MKRSYLPFVLWMLFMTTMLLMPSQKVPSALVTAKDWVVHSSIMFIATWLWYVPVIKKQVPLRYHFITVFMFMLYSIITEYVQETFISGRRGAADDIIANMAGVIIALVMVFLYRRLFRNNS